MSELTVSVLPAISAIDAAEWDGCGAGANPFTSHRFLAALEASGSVGPGAGWRPSHLIARLDGAVAGVAPAYLKTHSQANISSTTPGPRPMRARAGAIIRNCNARCPLPR